MRPVKLPRSVRFFLSALKRFGEHRGEVLAGHIAYSMFLSLFPFLIFVTALAGVLGRGDAADAFIQESLAVMPPEVAGVLGPVIAQVVANAGGGLLTFGMVGGIYVASNGVEAFRAAFNTALHVETQGNWFLRRLQSFAVVIGGAVVALMAMMALIVAPVVWTVVNEHVEIALPAAFVAGLLAIAFVIRYALIFLILVGTLALLYRLLPKVRQKFRNTLPGAVMASVLWLALALAFSSYLNHFAQYASVYGGLGGIVAVLIFFYATAVIVILGAEYNAVRRDHGPGME
ncbi:MAG: YihY/virulence factor BrkB family protein [Alphaproteobacteria bacterium]|nr:YihY/virulence factor BrkB family protein [Alphaproteobacteria bacterium]